MKRLICSAAVASALLAATAVPSGAASIGLFGMSAASPATYDDTYSFHVATSETVTVIGGEFNIANFAMTGPFTIDTVPSPTTSSTPTGTFGNFFGSATLGPGNYSFVVTGTGTPVRSLVFRATAAQLTAPV